MSRGSPPTSAHCFHTLAFCLLLSQSQSYFCLMPPPCPITETYLAKSTYILVVAKLLDKFQSFLSQLCSMFDTDNLGPVFVIFHTFGFYDFSFFSSTSKIVQMSFESGEKHEERRVWNLIMMCLGPCLLSVWARSGF